MNTKPTIKGLFVNSHINAVEKKLGKEGVAELERRFGKSIDFKNNQDVRVLDEIKIIEHALDLTSDNPIPPAERAYEAGRLHFTNFSSTPFAKLAFPMFRNNFKAMMLNAKFFAEHIFKGISFTSEDIGEKQVKVVMANNDYPIEHFRGLFQAWMDYSNLHGKVEAEEAKEDQFVFMMSWE